MVMIVIFEKTLTHLGKIAYVRTWEWGRHLLNGCLLACDYSTVLFHIFFIRNKCMMINDCKFHSAVYVYNCM